MLRAVTQRRGPAVIIFVRGEIDASNEVEWNYLVAEIAAAAEFPGPVVVDATDLDFMGCCAFPALARAAEHCRRRGVALCLVTQQPIVARMVAISGMRWLLGIYSTVEIALSRGIKEQ
ncbi:hypothetical protein AWC26_19470 [Mycobacterium shimoidei]|nr:anti-sigma factor antagonist [Mycobacterium shimoidei]ORW77439.1 hypothetical protein AWC26_19470 [Mycobacterium shimoidei]